MHKILKYASSYNNNTCKEMNKSVKLLLVNEEYTSQKSV